jgi:hypothetical protein
MARSPKRLAVEAILRAASDYVPDAIETPLRRALGVDVPRPNAKSLAVPRPAPRPKALPAPPKQLALPAPGPKLPRFAAKTKGGQWFVDKSIGGQTASDLGVKVAQLPDDGRWVVLNDRTPIIFNSEDEARAKAQSLVDEVNPNRSPENAARRIADNSLRLARDASGPLSELQNWFLRAAPRYMKNEMGTPDDPMRALAERDALHVALSPDEWSDAASGAISRQQIGSALGIDQLYTPAGSDPRAGYDYGASLAVNMPWLKKAPVTDELYGISDTYALQDKMGMGHMLDEMRNAMDPRSGLPSDLAVRPESLGRMGLAQAAERVGLINQFRAKEMERAALSNMDSPAVQTFKEYADDNPMGLRWTELRSPGDNAPLPEGWMPDGKAFYNDNTGESQLAHPSLQEALKYEGDTMGHCVGGYCDDVASGQSRIFSLRDAKGAPHVTIETRPGRPRTSFSEIPRDALDEITAAAKADTDQVTGPMGIGMDDPRWTRTYQTNLNLKQREWLDANPTPDDIVQIKGKQNAKPKDAYIPFVRDFVQSGKWGEIGDEENSGLRRLRGNLIPSDEYDKTLSDAYNWMRNSPGGQAVRKFYKTEMGGYGTDAYKEADKFINKLDIPVGTNSYSLNDILGVLGDPGGWDPENIESALQAVEYLKANPVELPPVFNGFAVGGRVDADRCFSYNPLTVKRGR